GFQADVAKVFVPEVVFEGINVEKLLEEEMLEAATVRIFDTSAEVFRDKRYELKPDLHKGMPQELMMNGLLEIKLDSLIVNNGKVIYREFPEKGLIPGEISFERINAIISPFYVTKAPENYPADSSSIDAEAWLNGEAPLSLGGEMYFHEPFPIHLTARV